MQASLFKRATIHQLITMLSTLDLVWFTGYNHLLVTGTDDPSLAGALMTKWVISIDG